MSIVRGITNWIDLSDLLLVVFFKQFYLCFIYICLCACKFMCTHMCEPMETREHRIYWD